MNEELPGLQLRVAPVKYEITKYPEGGVNASHFTMWVERRDIDRWCVTDMFQCYDKDGVGEYEPSPSSRTDEFKERFRFSLDEALDLAQCLVPQITLGRGRRNNGQTAEEVWAWEQGTNSGSNNKG